MKITKLSFAVAGLLIFLAPGFASKKTEGDPNINQTLRYLNKWVNKIGLAPQEKNCLGCKTIISVGRDGSLVMEFITLKSRTEQSIPVELLNPKKLSFKQSNEGYYLKLECDNGEKCVKNELHKYSEENSRVAFDNAFYLDLNANKTYNRRIHIALEHLVELVKKEFTREDPFARK